MENTDKKLLETYMIGFDDELEQATEKSFTNSQLQKAYDLGRTDALLGDDISSVDNQTNGQILIRIKK